jgi:ketopantoate hydroxymethyltransferase
MVGLYPRFRPLMAKLFAAAGATVRQGLESYVKEVTEGPFPHPENYFTMPDEAYDELVRQLAAHSKS